MTQLEKYFDSVLSNFEMDFEHEILVLYKSDIFFISIERLLLSLTILPMRQQDKVLMSVKRYQTNKPRFMNLLHDLAMPMLSIKV